MCAALMNLDQYSDASIKEAIDRKMKKFGSLLNMPLPTRKLVSAAQAELERRKQ